MSTVKEETRKFSVRIGIDKFEQLSKVYHTDSFTEVLNKLIDEKLKSKFEEQDTTRAPITAIGGKHRLAHRIVQLMPKHTIYIEPFGNTASVLFAKPKSKIEIYNDKESEVVNFYRVLKENPIGLYNRCTEMPYSQDLYYKLLQSSVPEDEISRAVRFFYLSRCSFMGVNTHSFRCSTGSRCMPKTYKKECERFYSLADRLSEVEIINKDFRKVIRKYKDSEEALFLCDPSYYGTDFYYTSSFKLQDHIDLARLLSTIAGKCMVCHDKNYNIHKLYTGLGFKFKKIRTKEVTQKCVACESGNKVKPYGYLYLYANYDIDKM